MVVEAALIPSRPGFIPGMIDRVAWAGALGGGRAGGLQALQTFLEVSVVLTVGKALAWYYIHLYDERHLTFYHQTCAQWWVLSGSGKLTVAVPKGTDKGLRARCSATLTPASAGAPTRLEPGVAWVCVESRRWLYRGGAPRPRNLC